MLLSSSWKNSKSFKNMKTKISQLEYYEQNNSTVDVLKLVKLESKSFGTISEKIIREIFNFGKRTSYQNDCTYNDIKIEIKCARYWGGKDECIWQHLELSYDYDYILFCLLDFNRWKIWCISKIDLINLQKLNIITHQGKQGLWTRKSYILPYLEHCGF
jgi:hypothetical protein